MTLLADLRADTVNEDKEIVDSRYRDYLYGLLIKWGKLEWNDTTASPQLVVDIEDEDFVECPYLPSNSLLVGDLDTNGYFFISKS